MTYFRPSKTVAVRATIQDGGGAGRRRSECGSWVERRQQTVFFALVSGVRLCIAVLGEQARFVDVPFVLHPREASRFVGRDADVLHDALFAETTVITVYRLDFEVAVGAALAADEPAAQHTLMRTAPYDRME